MNHRQWVTFTYLFSSFMLLVTVPYSHILCLDNRASAWHCLSVADCGHSLSQQSLTVAFQKASAWAASELFPDPSQILRVFTDFWLELGAAWQGFVFLFSDHEQTAMPTQGGCLFQRITKVPLHVARSCIKQLEQCTDKDSTVSLTCTHHNQTHRAGG